MTCDYNNNNIYVFVLPVNLVLQWLSQLDKYFLWPYCKSHHAKILIVDDVKSLQDVSVTT